MMIGFPPVVVWCLFSAQNGECPAACFVFSCRSVPSVEEDKLSSVRQFFGVCLPLPGHSVLQICCDLPDPSFITPWPQEPASPSAGSFPLPATLVNPLGHVPTHHQSPLSSLANAPLTFCFTCQLQRIALARVDHVPLFVHSVQSTNREHYLSIILKTLSKGYILKTLSTVEALQSLLCAPPLSQNANVDLPKLRYILFCRCLPPLHFAIVIDQFQDQIGRRSRGADKARTGL